jgi:hypothetical protein
MSLMVVMVTVECFGLQILVGGKSEPVNPKKWRTSDNKN